MCRGLIGKKIGMTGVFTAEGQYVPTTVVQVGPCVVTQIKTVPVDGYDALQLGFGQKKKSRVRKPQAGHAAKSNTLCPSILREVAVDNPEAYQLGQTVTLEMFHVGQRVDVSGTMKGRGFQGVIKRHGFHGGKDTHGSHSHRVPGSIGCSAWPAKVVRGKKMPGQYGNTRQTTKNLEIVDIRLEDNLIFVRGAVPGSRGGIVAVNQPKSIQN